MLSQSPQEDESEIDGDTNKSLTKKELKAVNYTPSTLLEDENKETMAKSLQKGAEHPQPLGTEVTPFMVPTSPKLELKSPTSPTSPTRSVKDDTESATTRDSVQAAEKAQARPRRKSDSSEHRPERSPVLGRSPRTQKSPSIVSSDVLSQSSPSIYTSHKTPASKNSLQTIASSVKSFNMSMSSKTFKPDDPPAEKAKKKKNVKMGSWTTVAFKNQKYAGIKKGLLKKGDLFVDPEFPPSNKSIFYSKIDADVEWKRPKELCKVPKLVVEGVTCDDLEEGELGNTWFVTACSNLAQEPKLWQKVVPNFKDQEYGDDQLYAGIFHFQFWRYGQTVDIVVDDLLPTKNGKLVFCHSKSRNEFWSALLEKAYAKLYGDYESLGLGRTADALVDFTGGVAEKLVLYDMDLEATELKNKLFYDMKEAIENKALVCCNIECSTEEMGQELEQGLIKGHGYGITDARDIRVNKNLVATVGRDQLFLLRLRNPWGTREWKGPWSDDSPEWTALSARDRGKMGIKFASEGDFWMSFDDFLKYFSFLDICHFVNTSVFSLKKTWTGALFNGMWTLGPTGSKRDRAGGCDRHPAFLRNPQYMFDIPLNDTLLVSLEQDDAQADKQSGESHKTIGFTILKVEDNRKYRVHLGGNKMIESQFVASRNVFEKVSLTKGRYVILPSTLKPEITGNYLLRMYTSGNAAAKEVIKDAPNAGCCIAPHSMVTTVRVVRAVGLVPLKAGASVDAYVIVKGEKDTVKSHYVRNSNSPEWQMKCIFYRKKTEIPIIVEVWNHNAIRDNFLGQATISQIGNEDMETIELDLFGKKKEAEEKKPGKLTIDITSSDDLTAL